MNWYILRCYSGHEVAIQTSVQERFGVECFVPIERTRQHDRHGRFVWRERCALSTYVFIHVERDAFVNICKAVPKTFAMQHKVNELWQYTTVRDEDMQSFILVSGNKQEQATYLDPSKLNFKQGDRVRIIGGSFVGVEGYFMQIGGKHEKRVIVQLPGLLAVATAAIPAALVEKI